MTEELREKVRKTVDYFRYHNKNLTGTQDLVLYELEDALEKSEGEWIEKDGRPCCSCCGVVCYKDTSLGNQKFYYCPSCGAKMNVE